MRIIAIALCFVLNFAHAQSEYQDLLSNPALDEYPTSSNASSPEIQNRLQKSVEELYAREVRLLQLKEGIEARGKSAISFVVKMQEMIETLPDATRQQVLSSSREQLDEISDSNVQKIRQILNEVTPEARELFQELDRYILDSLDMSLAISLYSVRTHLAEARTSPRLKRQYFKLVRYTQDYLKFKVEYGRGKDAHRTIAFKKFFTTLRSTYRTIGAYEEGYFKRMKKSMNRSFVHVAKLSQYFSPRLLIDFSSLVKTIVTNAQPEVSVNPLIRDLTKLTLSGAKLIPETVEVEGLENVPRSGAPDEVFLFTPSHREAFEDQIGVSHLGVDNLIPFAAANNFLPEILNKVFGLKDFLINRLNENLGIVVVGGKAAVQPLEKVTRILNETELRNILIYPGGRLPEGLGYTMGVREKFLDDEEGLIGQLQRLGYRVNIVPIAMRDNARLFWERRLTRSKVLNVKVAPVLKDSTRRVLAKLGDSQALGLLMRYGLIEEMLTNDELLWGQMRGSQLTSALSEYLFSDENTLCHELLTKLPTAQENK